MSIQDLPIGIYLLVLTTESSQIGNQKLLKIKRYIYESTFINLLFFNHWIEYGKHQTE
jgi:hypothetical protein